MVRTFMEKSQKKLLKKFHALLDKYGLSEDVKESILESYGVESSRDLSATDLLQICDRLTMVCDPKLAALEMWRNRVIGCIFGYYEVIGRAADMNYVKGTACQASGFSTFNEIPVGRLRNIYNEFNDKAKDYKRVNRMALNDLIGFVSMN